MIYSASITAAKGGSEAQPVSKTLVVTSGLLWLLEIDFPAGCCGLAHFQLFDGSYQVFPATPGESFACDGITLHLEDLYFKQAAPFQFIIKTWNTDTVWSHTIAVRIGMAMGRAEMSRYIPALAFEAFEELMAEMISNQEAVRQAQMVEALKQLTGEENGTGTA